MSQDGCDADGYVVQAVRDLLDAEDSDDDDEP